MSQKGPDLRRDYDLSFLTWAVREIAVRKDLIYEGITTKGYRGTSASTGTGQKGPDLRRDYDEGNPGIAVYSV